MDISKFTTISFPWLGLELNPPKGFQLFGFDIRFYGIIIALGLLLAVVYGLKRRAQFGLEENDILDGVLGIVPFAIICARAYYCIFSWSEFKDDPISVLYIWQGGIAIYGGVIGAALGVLVLCLIKKIRLGAVLDLVALGFLIGQAVGRWGNFFNREAFGVETDSFFRMGLLNSATQAYTYYHPTFLYESLWNLAGFVALHFLSKKRQYDGQIALGYAAWYGLGRTLIEGLRVDSLYLGTFRVSQLLAAITCFAATTALVVLAFKKHDRQNLYVNVVAAKKAALEEAAAAEVITDEAAPEELTDEAAPEEIMEETPAAPAEEETEN